MISMNKKNGFTTVELLVSFGLISVIVLFLFQIIFVVKNIFIDSGIKSKLLSKQAVISDRIQKDFQDRTILVASNCGKSCAEFIFADGETKKISYDRDKNTITYGTYKENLVEGSKFGNIEITSEILTSNINKNNGILSLKIPIHSSFFEGEDFGINLVYQFNSMVTSTSNLDIEDKIASPYDIFLVGSKKDVKFVDVDYNDPGYYLYDVKSGDTILNSTDVTVTGSVGNKLGETYDIIYKYKNADIGLEVEATRSITVISNTYAFKYINKEEIFTVPVDGTYKLETWGASGGGSLSLKGFGGYASGDIDLKKGDKLFVYVGGAGSVSSDKSSAPGGFNGGGASGSSKEDKGGSGGGATDIRLYTNKLDSRKIVAGGGGGGGSRLDSSFKCNGGSGGGATGLTGTCSSDSYLGQGGTSTAGGSKGSYTTNMTDLPTNGTLGVGGNGGSYSTNVSAGGGGGGYYGGGGGSRYGGGGGGSGYCDMFNCFLADGSETFPSQTIGSITGNDGNGLAKITLVSISS